MSENNILALIRLGFLPPDFKKEDLERTLYYIIWSHFRLVCYHGEVKSLMPPEIFCKKMQMSCDFVYCPIIKNSIRDFERKNRKFF